MAQQACVWIWYSKEFDMSLQRLATGCLCWQICLLFTKCYVCPLLQVKILVQSNGPRKGGGQQIDSLKKGARRRPQHVCVCACQWTLCVCVFWKFFSCRWCSDGNWKAVDCHSTPCYLVASREVLCVFCCPFFPLWKHTHTNTHSKYIHPCAGVCLPPTCRSPSITPHSAPRPPLSRKTPAVKVAALPASPPAPLKLHSVLWIPTLCTAFWSFVYITECFF